MTTAVTVTLTSICAGQNHFHLDVVVQGGATRALTFDTDELAAPIAPEMINDAVLVILKAHFRGRTKAQAKTELQAGMSLVI